MSRSCFFFRLDASPEIGLGHARRCAVLAEALSAEGGEAVFAIRSHGLPLHKLGLPKGAQVELLPWDITPQEDAQRLVTIATKAQATMGVVDHYRQDAEYQIALAQGGLRWLQFASSGSDMPLGGDILHDASVGPGPDEYAGRRLFRKPRKVLSGPKYALVGSNFGEVRKVLPPWDQRQDTLVTFGGGDDRGAIIEALNLLDEVAWPGRRVVLTTCLNPRLPQIAQLCQGRSDTTLHVDEWSPARLIAGCRIGLCGGGTTLYELATLGVPALVRSIAENQVVPAERWEAAGMGRYLGKTQRPITTLLLAQLRALALASDPLRRWSQNCLSQTDGQGARRTASALMELHPFSPPVQSQAL